MQASILMALSTMSNSLGAYLKPTRLLSLPTFTDANGDGHPDEELLNGVHREDEKQGHDHVASFDIV
jgi:hypothetical protein